MEDLENKDNWTKLPLFNQGHYNDEGEYINQDGIQICEWCGSDNITDPVPGTMNGLCHNCGSHW